MEVDDQSFCREMPTYHICFNQEPLAPSLVPREPGNKAILLLPCFYKFDKHSLVYIEMKCR